VIDMDFTHAILFGWLGLAVFMAILWSVQRRTGNAGIVDIAWTLGVGVMAALFATSADGDSKRRVLIACIAGVWSIRLTLHLLLRTLGEPEDGRYQELRRRWGERTQPYLFIFFQIQASWAVLFALPMWIAARNPRPLGWLDAAAVTVWLVSLAGEAVADRQLSRFRTREGTSGQVCRDGLWRYSRHPNYFFEWIHWWAYVLLAVGAPLGWLALGGPLVMLYFLLKVTGIPPTEARALISRGDAYRDYQRTTSAFFPWPPEKTEND